MTLCAYFYIETHSSVILECFFQRINVIKLNVTETFKPIAFLIAH